MILLYYTLRPAFLSFFFIIFLFSYVPVSGYAPAPQGASVVVSRQPATVFVLGRDLSATQPEKESTETTPIEYALMQAVDVVATANTQAQEESVTATANTQAQEANATATTNAQAQEANATAPTNTQAQEVSVSTPDNTPPQEAEETTPSPTPPQEAAEVTPPNNTPPQETPYPLPAPLPEPNETEPALDTQTKTPPPLMPEAEADTPPDFSLLPEPFLAAIEAHNASPNIRQPLHLPHLTIHHQITWEQASLLLPRYSDATIMDVATGLSFRIRRTFGTNHADIEALTKADTATIYRIWGGHSWERRAVVVITDTGHVMPASMNGFPHAGVDGVAPLAHVQNRSGGFGPGTNLNLISGNGMHGHLCLHFAGSRTHGSQRIDEVHQTRVGDARAFIRRHF